MVYITHSGENLEKIRQILEVAQKRFGIYGLEKTTMREIAEDLGISKASLYYYFPDKEHIFKAVAEKEQEDFFQEANKIVESDSAPDLKFREFIRINIGFYKNIFSLSRFRSGEFKQMKSIIGEMLHQFRSRQVSLVTKILERGIREKRFFMDDPAKIASLYLEMLRGMRFLTFHNKEFFAIEKEDYDALEEKLNILSELFLKGLMYKKEIG